MPRQNTGTGSQVTQIHQKAPGKKWSVGTKVLVGGLISAIIVVFLGVIALAGFYFKMAIDEAIAAAETINYPENGPPANSSVVKKTLAFGTDGLGQGEFKRASAIAVGKDGSIYVGDGTLRIQKFDPNGKFLQLWNATDSSVTTNEDYSNNITDLAIDSKNVLYAVVEHEHLLRYNGDTGEFIDRIPLYGDKFVNKVMEARVLDIVMQNDDKLAVFANSFPDSEFIFLVSPDGKVQTKHKNLLKNQANNSTPLMAGNMLISALGDIFLLNGVVMQGKSYIYHFKSDGGYVDRFTWEGAPTMGISGAKSIAINSKGEIYVYNKSKQQINVLSSDGVFQRSIPIGVAYFEAMVLDSNEMIYILSGNKVERFPAEGK